MIVRFFKTGTSNGEAPITYLLGARNHNGELRAEPPEVIEGTPELTIDIINSIHRKHKYSSGCIAFRPEEQPTREQLHQIIEKFKLVVAPNLLPDSINSLFVLHRDKLNPKTGLAGFHIHFILPMVQLNGRNAGRRWNPHPPGKESIEIMSLFTSLTNHQYGWKQVQPNPLRVNVSSFWKKVEGKPITRKTELLQQELQLAMASGQIKNREQLCDFLADTLGMEITRKGVDYLSVRFPGAGKAIRLKGPMFVANTNFEKLQTANFQRQKAVSLTDIGYQTKTHRLSELLSKRGQMLTDSAIKKIKFEEINYGKQSTTSTNRKAAVRRPESFGQSASSRYGTKASHSAHSAGSLWGNGTLGNGSKETHTLLPTYPGAGQKENLRVKGATSQPKPGGGQLWLGKTPTTSAEIDDQIRQLTIALTQASDSGYREIQDQINRLAGKKENLPKPT